MRGGERGGPGPARDRVATSARTGRRVAVAKPSHLIFFPPPPAMFFSRLTLGFLLVTVAAFFCAQSVEAAKGPRITHKVYFDIKHGDKDMGRGARARTNVSWWEHES